MSPGHVLESLFIDNPQAMFTYSLKDYRIINVNDAALCLYKYSREEFLQQTLFDLKDPSDREALATILKEIDPCKNYKWNSRYCNSSGATFLVEVFTYPIEHSGENARLVLVNNIQEAIDFRESLAQKAMALQQIMENSIDVICAFDAEGKFIECSKSSLEVWGYSPEELIGKPYINFVIEEDKALTQQIATKIYGGLALRNFQNRYRRKNGSIVPIVWSAKWNTDQQLMFCIARDATEKVTVEKLLEEQSNKLEEILESITDAFFSVDKEWNVTYWNREAERILKRERRSILNKNIWEVYPDVLDLKFFKKYHEAITEVKTVHFEEYYPTLGIWCEVTAYPHDEGLTVFFKDITEKFKTQQLLQESNERYDIIAKATNDIIWDWNLSTGAIDYTEPFSKILGYEPDDEIRHMGWWMRNIHPEDASRVKDGILGVIETGGVWSDEYRLKCMDGSYKYFLDRGFLIRNDEGNAVRMIGSMQDITKLKEKEFEILEKNKKLREIAFLNSHEVRKPLANILGLIKLLEEEIGSHEILTLLKQSGCELDQIVNQIAKKSGICK